MTDGVDRATVDADVSARRAAERALDRDAHVATYRPVVVGERAPAPPVDEDDRAVRAFAATLTKLPESERAERLRLLAEFVAFVAESPAEMIELIFDREAYRYVRRDHYSRRIVEFSATAPGSWDERKAAGDVIRAFFHANGHTIAPAVPSRHLWLRMP